MIMMATTRIEMVRMIVMMMTMVILMGKMMTMEMVMMAMKMQIVVMRKMVGMKWQMIMAIIIVIMVKIMMIIMKWRRRFRKTRYMCSNAKYAVMMIYEVLICLLFVYSFRCLFFFLHIKNMNHTTSNTLGVKTISNRQVKRVKKRN